MLPASLRRSGQRAATTVSHIRVADSDGRNVVDIRE